MSVDSLGRGLRFPLLTGEGFGWVSGEAAVEQSIRAILLTEPGERIARPSYGVGLRRFLFAQNSLELRTQIRQAVVEALERDEPRIRVETVAVESDAREPTVLRIAIRYAILDQPGVRNLVFPFYLTGGA
ncbi:MAG TPA: GPW/gp25 family protein [Accumulibacter sp.]|nr:GPW/gp25 family protein [Accumulibacter sp.]HMX23879.1 GPW/gp25 family protein [Accumulibacter sp.]HNG39316.1 GPW/gp25 family protein [Accumulibacter sp.]HNH24716.1 GPW/gp25 family protein [Accumulibacter sp.]